MSATDKKPLPFVYQFAAGAIAGVSEVRKLRGDFTAAIDYGEAELTDGR